MSVVSTVDLTLALFNEHKQRTGHDCTKPNTLHHISCDVCLYLRSMMQAVGASSMPPEPKEPA